MAIVTTIYPGASPADIEELVTDKLEERLKNLEQLKKLESESSEGVSSLVVEFEASANLKDSIRNLRDEVDAVKSELPENAEDSIVTEVRLDDQPIITVSLVANLPPEELKQSGEDLQDLLEGIPGVSEVLLSGLERKEMQVFIDIKKLEGYEISLEALMGTIASNHLDFPIGSVRTDGFYYQLSLKGQFASLEELQAFPIAQRGRENIYLRDIAEVREAFSEKNTTSNIYKYSDQSYRQSVTLQVKKKTGGNIVKVADAVKIKAEEFRNKRLPPGATIMITNDWSKYIRESIYNLGNSGWQTILIIFATLIVSLGVRESILVSFSIPLIILMSFIGLALVGETLNDLVFFSLVLSLGIIVDTSTVIMEEIYNGIKFKSLTGREASLRAIRVYKSPLIAGTLTMMAVFVPMLMMSGIMGEFVKHIPITINITLVFSLFVAIFLIPAIATRIFRDHHRLTAYQKARQYKPIFEDAIERLRVWYVARMQRILHSARLRRAWIIGVILAFFITMAFPFVGILKVQMFPSIDFEFFTANIELPIGSALENTAAVVAKVEAKVKELPEVDNFVTILGRSSSGISIFESSQQSSHLGSITINLLDKGERDLRSSEIAELLREKITSITEAKVTVSEVSAGPPTGAPIEVRILGNQLAELENIANQVTEMTRAIPGTRDVTTDIEHGTGEFYLELRRDRLNYYGVSALQVGSFLRTAIFGNDTVKIVESGEETPIVVVLDFRKSDCKSDQTTQLLEKRDKLTLCRNEAQEISQIENLLLSTPRGMVPISEFAKVTLHPAVTVIHHLDAETVVKIHAYTKEGTLPSEVSKMLQTKIDNKKADWSEDIRIEVGGETEDVTESFVSLGRAGLVAIFLVAFILVVQFDSYRQCLIILSTLPLSMIGVFVGLVVTGRQFSFPGFIGVVSLLGIAVNTTIVLIDRINYHIHRGRSALEAITQAGSERMRPIILTAVSTIVGVIPLMFADEMWIDLNLAIFFGCTFGTILTLLIVPIFYYTIHAEKEILEDIKLHAEEKEHNAEAEVHKHES
jgi:multidrug efflux pump subunit AcrB